MATPTSAANLAMINRVYNQLEPLMINLSSRWRSESAFENTDDYGDLPATMEHESMSKRPFGFSFTINTEAKYFMGVNAKRRFFVLSAGQGFIKIT